MADLSQVIEEGIKRVIDWVVQAFMDALNTGYESLTAGLFGTPTPQTGGSFIFGEPANAPWPAIREALVGGEVMILSLLILLMGVQGRHTIRIFNIGSASDARKTRKTAWVGAFLIMTWYWLAALTLYLVEGFTIALLPELSSITAVMIDYLAVSITNPVLGLVFAMLGGLAMWALQALFYLRTILLFVYLYAMPLVVALAYGNVPMVSDIALGFSRRFVPLAVLPLPAAMVFKMYDFLYAQGALNPSTAFLKLLVAVSLPLIALYVTWKTFQYATPLTANLVSAITRTGALVGGVAAGAYVGGASVATTAARWGPRAAAGHALADSAGNWGGQDTDIRDDGSPSYRRTENDPTASTGESSTGKRGMEFDRGIH